MESKPVKVLGRPAKTDAPFWGLGASPMLSSIKLKWGHGILYCDCRPKVGPEFVALLIGVQFSAVTPF